MSPIFKIVGGGGGHVPLSPLDLRIFVAKHVSLSTDSRLLSGVNRFSPFFKLINMPTHYVHNAWEQNSGNVYRYTRENYHVRTY